ncbi:MAG: hypothetical protein FWG15_03790 [Propionibacteriaceae bacterium]|nr:hypothetical protein [Propionibacteriaceae bacterium]
MAQFQSESNPDYDSQPQSEYSGAPQEPAPYSSMPHQGSWLVQGGQPLVPMMYVAQPPRGFAIAGMVLGILSLAFMFMWSARSLVIPLAIIGFVLSFIGIRKPQGGMATAGLIRSAIPIAILPAILLINIGWLFGRGMFGGL